MGIDPLTMLATASIVLAGTTLYKGYQDSQAAKENEKAAKAAGIAAREKAAYDEASHRERVRSLISKQRALYGKAGVTEAGSPLLVLEDTARKGELDALAIRYGGEVESSRQKSRARVYGRQGTSSLVAGGLSAGSSLLSGYAEYKDRR